MAEVLIFFFGKEDESEIQILNFMGLETKELISFTAKVMKTLAEFSPYHIERDKDQNPIIKITLEDNSYLIWSSETKKTSIQLLANVITIMMQAVK